MVIQDSIGEVLCSLSKQLPQAYTPFEIKALVALTALQLALDMGFRRAVLETDSQILVKAMLKDRNFLSSDGLLIEDVKFFAKFFNQLHYSHVKREGNFILICSLLFRLGITSS